MWWEEKQAQARLELTMPDIWLSFSRDKLQKEAEELRKVAKSNIPKLKFREYEKFLSS
jgi:hypothetical protein